VGENWQATVIRADLSRQEGECGSTGWYPRPPPGRARPWVSCSRSSSARARRIAASTASYVSIVDPAPRDLEHYRLKIGGIVENGLSISVPALRTRFENVVEPITLACVGNPPEGSLVSAGYFRGVRVRDVLDAAKVSDRAEAAIITGLDGYVAPHVDRLRLRGAHRVASRRAPDGFSRRGAR